MTRANLDKVADKYPIGAVLVKTNLDTARGDIVKYIITGYANSKRYYIVDVVYADGSTSTGRTIHACYHSHYVELESQLW